MSENLPQYAILGFISLVVIIVVSVYKLLSKPSYPIHIEADKDTHILQKQILEEKEENKREEFKKFILCAKIKP